MILYPFFPDKSPSIVKPVICNGSKNSRLSESISISDSKTALLIATPTDLKFLIEDGDSHQSSESAGNYNSWIVNRESFQVLIAGPVLGAPAAVIACEQLIASGIKRIVFFGVCGSLCKKLKCGDVFMPTLALRSEGTSYHYIEPQKTTYVCQSLQRQLSERLSSYGKIQNGVIWTTDAPYRETLKAISWAKDNKAMAVDMETSALIAVCAYHRIEFTAILVTSDSVGDNWERAFDQSKVLEIRKKITKNLLHILLSEDFDENSIC